VKRRIVIKIGSNVLTRDDGKLDITRMSSLVDQTAWLTSHGYEVIIVSSGAMASGRGEIKVSRRLDSVAQRQLYSALGQAKLINLYYDLFREYHLPVGQVLTMKENFNSRRAYLNQRACMTVMLENGVIPIVNENDTVSVTELMFTDNDELSGLIASMMDAETLIILSNIDGIYDGPPQEATSKVIRRVEPGSDLSEYIQSERSGFGRGGMKTKYHIARKVADEGIRVIIANGKRDHILIHLMEHPDDTEHTEFIPVGQNVSGIKKWLAHSDRFTKGSVHVNQQACKALCGDNAVSLLLVGVTSIDGDFEEGDLVNIIAPDGTKIATGRSTYSSTTASQLIGQHGQRPIVHYDYLYME
jgi:glutamate 5-kinase